MSGYAVIHVKPDQVTLEDTIYFGERWHQPKEINHTDNDTIEFVNGKKKARFSIAHNLVSKRIITEPVEMWNVNGALFPTENEAESYAVCNSAAYARTTVMILG